jgi:hypothetical protein
MPQLSYDRAPIERVRRVKPGGGWIALQLAFNHRRQLVVILIEAVGKVRNVIVDRCGQDVVTRHLSRFGCRECAGRPIHIK